MKGRMLWLGWVGLLVFVVMAVGLTLRQKGIYRQLASLVNMRKALETDYQKAEDKLKKDLTRYVKVLRRFPWLLESGSGTAFLTRLSDVASDHLLEIVGVGPLERKRIGQVERLGRRVKVSGSFSDILGVVEKVERNRGIMDGLTVKLSDQKEKNNGAVKLEAQFSLVTAELSTPVRKRMRSLLVTALDSKEANDVPVGSAPQIEWNFEVAALRDPFMPVRPFKANEKAQKVTAAIPSFPEMRLSGIVHLPNKKMAIINDRMLGVGDRFDGILVEQVTDDAVVLKSESAGKRIRLPTFMSGSTIN